MASGGSGGPSRGGTWPSSLRTPETDELIDVGLMVPPGCRLPREFHIIADGYPTRGPGMMPDELRRHRGGRCNIADRHRYWDGKDYWAVVGELQQAAPHLSRAATADAAVATAATAAREAADLQVALDAVAAAAVVEPADAPAVEHDDGVYWEAAVKSSDDKGDDSGAGEVMDLADSDNE
ncbi:hypothetical protein VPH35_039457 [Triticum aestivum]